MKNQPMSFGEAVSYSVCKTDKEIDKKYKGEKRTKAKEVLGYANEYFSSRPVGWNINQDQNLIKDECEAYVKDKFRQSPPEKKWLAEPNPNGPVGFAILGLILMAIIGWVIRKLLDHFWNNSKI